jgi:hypothetical protein
MEFLASLFVGKPLNILAVAALFLAGHLLVRFTAVGAGQRLRPSIMAAAAWGLYAG